MIETVADLINELAGLPPMMPIGVFDLNNQEEKEERLIRNKVIVNDGNVPVLFLVTTDKIEHEPDIAVSYEEKMADKKHKALAMGAESRRAREGLQ